MSNKRRGGFSEAIFTAIAQYKHIHVASPVTPEKYDFVMRMDQKWFTVQVKSLTHDRGRRSASVRRSGHKGYEIGDFDYLAIIDQKNLTSWLIPSHLVSGGVTVSPYLGKWDEYRWHTGHFDPSIPVKSR